jgi:hypothetical protein
MGNKNTKNKEDKNLPKSGSLKDYAYGCILGAFIADSCGSFNEFNLKIADE